MWYGQLVSVNASVDRRPRYLDFNLSFSSSLVAYRAISPSLDKIATTSTPGEFKVNGKGILLGNGEVGA